ncbi:MAG: TolC family protein [Candidatus Omnitrophota bacterium]|jgi:TolC family type I secretion outer membrane protein
MMKKYVVLPIILFLLGFLCRGAMAEEILSWEDCLAEARQNHPDLISAVESVKQQKASKAITSSGLFPQIDTNLGASTAGTNTTNTTTDVTTKATTDTYTYGVSGTQLIFDGFKTLNQVKSAAENIKAAQENYRFTSSSVRLNLRTAFVNLLKAQELIKVAEEIARIRKGSLELITLRYESGLEHRGALLTAEANLAEALFELAQAKRDVGLSQRQLAKEMGRKEFQPVSVNGDFSVREESLEKPDLEMLAKNHPSLLQALAKMNAAAFEINSAYAEFAPALSGDAGANKKSSHWPPQDDNWNLGLSVTLPIFEGGLRMAQVSKARAAYNQLEADARSTGDSLVVGLEKSWVALQDAIETTGVQRKVLNAAEERSKIAEAQYSVGFITFDNWIIIENDLVSAKKAFLSAQANALLAEANWIQAKGETLEYAQ